MVFFLRMGDDGPIKIGVTRPDRFQAHIKALQAGNPVELRVLLVVEPGNAGLEGRFRRAFALDQIRGLWFRPTDAILAVLWRAGQAEGRENEVLEADLKEIGYETLPPKEFKPRKPTKKERDAWLSRMDRSKRRMTWS